MTAAVLLVGRPNAGKSLFFVSFLDFLGVDPLTLHRNRTSGIERVVWTRREAERHLVGEKATASSGHYLAFATLSRHGDPLALIDGFPLSARPEPRGAYISPEMLPAAEAFLHVIDASEVGQKGIDPLDLRLLESEAAGLPALVIANKADLAWGPAGAVSLTSAVSGRRIIPASAKTRRGFREIRSQLQAMLAEVKNAVER